MSKQHTNTLLKTYTWLKSPILGCAPMRPYVQAELAIAVAKAGGFGFIGFTPSSVQHLGQAKETLGLTDSGTVPIGLAFVCFYDDFKASIDAITQAASAGIVPAAVWLFAPTTASDLKKWSESVKEASHNLTRIWVQVGSVQDALDAVEQCGKDVVIIAQGSDAGGHGLIRGASIINLVPGVIDAFNEVGYEDVPVLAAGGLVEPRGLVAASILGAAGCMLGTRFLNSNEAVITKGFQKAITEATDGGQATVRTRLYDDLLNRQWPPEWDGRALINQSWVDAQGGMSLADNRKRYDASSADKELGYTVDGRLGAYVGAGIGLIKDVKPAAEIIDDLRKGMTVLQANQS